MLIPKKNRREVYKYLFKGERCFPADREARISGSVASRS
jgi:hypothetical protein